MSSTLVRRVAAPRRALAELDPNRDLNNPRGQSKRAPIVFEQENEAAVLEGLRLGTYDFDEVVELTDEFFWSSTASMGDDDSSDGEPASPVGGAFESGEASDGELVEEFGEADDELLGDVMTEDLADEISEHDEHDEQVESEEQFQGPVFDPSEMGLKEINNLAHFGVSSHKPGSGVKELLSEDLDKYWQ